jgi:outer membrane lipoprotein LolB
VIRLTLLILGVSLLTACAQSPVSDSEFNPDSKTQRWLEHQISVSGIHAWNIKGRIAVKNEKESGTVTLFWNQFLSNYELRLVAPLGQGTYVLTGTSSSVVMKGPKDLFIEADDAEELLQQGLGWDVHLNGLKYWVRGLPEPDIKYSELSLDDKGRLTSMKQSGFDVSVSRYAELDDFSLPEKLTIESDKIRLKVVIQNWNL